MGQVVWKPFETAPIHNNDGIRDLHQIAFNFTRNREIVTSIDWEGSIEGEWMRE